jgi:hypothetical protein
MNKLENKMNPKKLEENINNGVRQLLSLINQYSESQKELWREIPYLALEADGRDGFSDNYRRAYKSGFWALDSSNLNGYCTVYVDLATGKLVDAYFASDSFRVVGYNIPKESQIKPANEENIILLAFNMEELDAREIIASLKKERKISYVSYKDAEEQEAWRERTRKELGLKRKYSRKKVRI